jgi:hypothetical protein
MVTPRSKADEQVAAAGQKRVHQDEASAKMTTASHTSDLNKTDVITG